MVLSSDRRASEDANLTIQPAHCILVCVCISDECTFSNVTCVAGLATKYEKVGSIAQKETHIPIGAEQPAHLATALQPNLTRVSTKVAAESVAYAQGPLSFPGSSG